MCDFHALVSVCGRLSLCEFIVSIFWLPVPVQAAHFKHHVKPVTSIQWSPHDSSVGARKTLNLESSAGNHSSLTDTRRHVHRVVHYLASGWSTVTKYVGGPMTRQYFLCCRFLLSPDQITKSRSGICLSSAMLSECVQPTSCVASFAAASMLSTLLPPTQLSRTQGRYLHDTAMCCKTVDCSQR